MTHSPTAEVHQAGSRRNDRGRSQSEFHAFARGECRPTEGGEKTGNEGRAADSARGRSYPASHNAAALVWCRLRDRSYRLG